MSIAENGPTPIQKVWYCIILMESLSMMVSSKYIQAQMIIQYTLEGFLSPFILGYILQGKNISTHHMVNRISHSTTLYLLSDALSQYDMLKSFSDEHYNS